VTQYPLSSDLRVSHLRSDPAVVAYCECVASMHSGEKQIHCRTIRHVPTKCQTSHWKWLFPEPYGFGMVGEIRIPYRARSKATTFPKRRSMHTFACCLAPTVRGSWPVPNLNSSSQRDISTECLTKQVAVASIIIGGRSQTLARRPGGRSS